MNCPSCHTELGKDGDYWKCPECGFYRRGAIMPPNPDLHKLARAKDFARQSKCDCCDRGDEYNGFGSDGPTLFTCPKSCTCHD